jgi:antitoxin component YwqK of YwqJK toxin-antitoxin module
MLIFVELLEPIMIKKKLKVMYEYFTMNGKKEGIYKEYHYNGQLRSEVNYIDGKKV